jgi:hypothetical protein
MRATINFEVDVEKVENTMAALVSNQAPILRTAANILDNLGGPPLLNEVSEALDLLQEASFQLNQYRDMLASFQRARFETLLPQEAPAALESIEELRKETKNTMNLVRNVEELNEVQNHADKFGQFIDKLNAFGEEGGDDVAASEEG